MAYDHDLADRVRRLIGQGEDVSETRMFGGLAFLVGGNMAIAVSGQGGVLVRADPLESDELVATTDAEFAVMRGRPMAGWLRVGPDHLQTRDELARWVAVGTTHARALPAKR
jgi:TfoX/Sxy family transcriptional regulator of competence genes